MKFYPLSISALWKNLLFLFLYHRSTLFSFQGTILLKRIFDFCLSALHHVSHTFCCRSVHSAFLCSSCGASRPRVARSVHNRNFLLRKKRWFGLDFCSFPNPLHTFCCRSVHSAFCAPHAALRVRVSHAPCTVAIFCFAKNCFGGDEENRTPDPLLARQVLSQLSYTPKFNLILRQNRLAVPTYCLRRFFLG